ncbi:MAG: OsmC family protein [Bdellovibrionales bacterium]|nr:OsmC family protein [Bdellovibrionales bacterium]
MAVEIFGTYLGDKKLELRHGPSGTKILTAAPIDNNGDGSSFSPTDLCAASLGACVTTVMAIFAENSGIDLTGTTFKVEKHMESNPRRIGSLPVEIHLPKRLTEIERTKLERVGRTCPVCRSLGEQVHHELNFVYDV